MSDPARRTAGSSLWGGVLGAILLGWAALMLLAPEIGSLIAVFGSPVLAWFIIVRLVGGAGPEGGGRHPPEAGPGGPRGRTLSDLRRDPALLARVSARSGGACGACGAAGPLSLHAILPVGRGTHALDQRFEALCAACSRNRSL
jgi:hypothetical protein